MNAPLNKRPLMKAPYNFVPVSEHVFLPDWAGAVSHDMPFKEGISGLIDCELTALSPILVGGGMKKNADQSSTIEFCKNTQGKPIIQGTSLKGMLRNVLEIASFSKMHFTDDQNIGVRDLTDAAKPYYRDRMLNKVKTGWLKFENQRWRLYPCSMARVKKDELSKIPEIGRALYKNRAFQRYEELNVQKKGFYKLDFDLADAKNCTLGINLNSRGATQSGYLVLTGNISKKNKEFLFFAPKDDGRDLSSKVVESMIRLHKANPQNPESDWDWFQKHKISQQAFGIPIFYLEERGSVTATGLAYMFKLPYKLSTHEALGNTSAAHLKNDKYDFSELIFGAIRDEGEQSLRSRVSVSEATCTAGTVVKQPVRLILSSPHPSYFPTYIKQQSKKSQLSGQDYDTLSSPNARLAGWKRYPVSNNPQPSNALDSAEKKSTHLVLNPLEAGAKFRFKVRFHNLLPAELGGLLWVLTWGEDSNLRHSLGVGKPFGLGQSAISVKNLSLISNNSDDKYSLTSLTGCFQEMMNNWYQTITNLNTWQESPELFQLKSMAKVDCKSWQSLEYMSIAASDTGINEFVESKKQRFALSEYADYHQFKIEQSALNEAKEKEAKAALINSLTENQKQVEEWIQTFRKMAPNVRVNNKGMIEKWIDSTLNDAWKTEDRAYLKAKITEEGTYLNEKNPKKKKERNKKINRLDG